MAGTIPARERFLAIPAAERDALDLLYLGEFHRAAGQKDEAIEHIRRGLTANPSEGRLLALFREATQ